MQPPANQIIYYDGHCGLCHRFVRFVLARDKDFLFRFAPLQGKTFLETIPQDARDSLPDTIVVQTQDGLLKTRSSAVLHVWHHLGGAWKIIGAFTSLIPAWARDHFYDFIARIRYRLFRKPENLCPLVPEALQRRFLP